MVNSNLLLKIPSMAIGAAGVALSSYSIVKDGNAKARCETKEELGERYVDMYVKNLSSSRESHLLEKIKHYVMKLKLDNSFFPFLLQTKNHVVHWVGETVENIVPITLSALAIGAPVFFKKHGININKKIIRKMNRVIKKIPLVNKIYPLPKAKRLGVLTAAASAGLLVLGAGKFFVHDVLGVGKNKEY